MTSGIAEALKTVSCSALLVCVVAACGDGEKPTDAKAGVLSASSTKTGPSQAAIAGQLATAMVNGEAAKGTTRMGPLGADQRLDGTLGDGDAKRDDGSFFDAWVFELSARTGVSIDLQSTAFDAYLSLYEGEPGSLGEFMGSDDDGGQGTNAALTLSLASGTYTAMANSYGAGESGAYTIGFQGDGVGGGRGLRAGQTVNGSLATTDETLGDGSYYQDWTFTGQSGERVTVTLRSGDFDAYLMIMQAGETLTSDDDNGGGTDSQIVFTLPANGTYTVRANTFGAGETGAFTITVESGGGPAPFTGFGTGGDPDGRYALLVGIDDYPGTGSDLRGPVEDARIMERVLIERFGFDPANVVTLNDSDATRQNIAQGVAQHLGQAGPNGVAVFFYSGHGTQIGENIGLTGSLDPEPRGEGDEAIYIYGYDSQSSVILDEELGFLIETIDAGRTLVVVDACFSGEITRGPGDAPQTKIVDLTDPQVAASVYLPTNFITSELKALNLTDMSLGFGDFSRIAEVFRNPQRHIMWGASTEDQVSWTSGLGNGASVFTYYMGEQMMSVPGSTTFFALNRAVHDDVVAYIEGDGNMTMQNPQMRGDNQTMTLDDFFRRR